HRELQRSPARRAARRRNLLHSARGPNRHRELAAALQHNQAARIARIQAASTGGICPCLRRMAGCATPPGSAGHASATASLKLTFHLDHSVGANQRSPVFCGDFLHDLDLEITLGNELLQPRILGLELLQAPDVVRLKATETLAPGVDRPSESGAS